MSWRWNTGNAAAVGCAAGLAAGVPHPPVSSVQAVASTTPAQTSAARRAVPQPAGRARPLCPAAAALRGGSSWVQDRAVDRKRGSTDLLRHPRDPGVEARGSGVNGRPPQGVDRRGAHQELADAVLEALVRLIEITRD